MTDIKRLPQSMCLIKDNLLSSVILPFPRVGTSWKGLMALAEEPHGHLSSLLGDSLVLPEVDFDRLLASLQDLSELVVEGDTQVKPVPGGARFHVLEPIPLKLYRNGIMMFDGPFRPFCDPSTQVGAGSGSLGPLLGDSGASSLSPSLPSMGHSGSH
jgi:hypothetical protein